MRIKPHENSVSRTSVLAQNDETRSPANKRAFQPLTTLLRHDRQMWALSANAAARFSTPRSNAANRSAHRRRYRYRLARELAPKLSEILHGRLPRDVGDLYFRNRVCRLETDR